MPTEVINLAEFREVRRLRREVDELLERSRRTNFKYDLHARKITVLTQMTELERRHGFLLRKLRPAIRELMELQMLLEDPPRDQMSSAFALAIAAGFLLEDGNIVSGLPERIAKRQAEQFDHYQRLLREFGPGLFEVNSIS